MIKTNLTPQSWEEVDRLGKRLVELEIEKSRLDGDYNLAIQEIKEKQSNQLKPLISEVGTIEKAIQGFCEMKKAEFATKRSKELTFVKVGYRLVTSVSIPRVKEKVESLIAAIQSYGYADSCLEHIQKPNKEALAELPDEALVRLGLKRSIKDSFRIEPKIETLSDTIHASNQEKQEA